MSSYAIRQECLPPVCSPSASRIACHRSVRCAPHFLVNPALATVFPTQGRGARETRKRAVLTATGERGARLTGGLRGCPCQKARGGMGHGPSKDTSKWKGARGWPCGVRERVFRIGPIRHCISDRAIYFDMPTCRHADMLDKGITGLFGTASERDILMAGVGGKEPLGPCAVGANKRGIRRAPDQLSRVSTTLASLSVSFTWLSSTKRRSGAMPWVSTRYSLVFWARRMARFRRDLAVMSC